MLFSLTMIVAIATLLSFIVTYNFTNISGIMIMHVPHSKLDISKMNLSSIKEYNSNGIFDLKTHLLNSIFNFTEKSIVQITRKSPVSTPLFHYPFPPSPSPDPDEKQNMTVLGSGFVYDKQGHIITNYHVVDNAKFVDITFIDGNKYTAAVLGKDPLSDLAVLKIIEKLNEPLRPLTISNSTSINIGDTAIAIGNPYGLDNTMTAGIISQVNRLIEEPSGISITDMIQTDAAINPGNSGGPLLNIKGQVIGINTAKGAEGEGFAISSNTILKEVPILIQKINFTHSYLGLNGTTMTPDLAKQFKNVPKTIKGVYVNMLAKGGPADKAGIKGMTIDYYGQNHGGDIITAADNKSIIDMDNLVTYIDQHTRPGDTTVLTIFRDNHYIKLDVNISTRPTSLIIMPI
ncbi:MAG TPA: trypsin-like peptidase domain-containing protein [Verrucomicrobiae bacterium]|nr:trypsin-like peptidase domain-containing protein [Verrucomicrobiae bacterium]